jgi:hypothetical protein
MDTSQKAKTIRLDEQDWQAIAAIKEYAGIRTDNDAIRFALREWLRAQRLRAKAEGAHHCRGSRRGLRGLKPFFCQDRTDRP